MLSLLGNFFYVIFTQPIFNVLMLLNYVLGDFGLSIILLTIIIRLILYPLFLKQLKSSKAMQDPDMQREIAEVKKEFRNDQRAQLQATQEIYKKYGINPAAGCLPLLIQLPVLYGLFNSLNTLLRGHPTVGSINSGIYPFLPHITRMPDVSLNWFTFISPHAYINLGNPDPTHILPILAAIFTFIQLRMSLPPTSATTATPKNAMAQQMRIMQYIMPVFTLFFAWAFPAGLALYWTTSTVFSMVQQYTVTKWGSLPELLRFLPTRSESSASTARSDIDKSKTHMGDSSKETRLLESGKTSETGEVSSEGPIASKLARSSNNGSNDNGARSTSGPVSSKPVNSSNNSNSRSTRGKSSGRPRPRPGSVRRPPPLRGNPSRSS